MADVPPFRESFLARIVNVNWGTSPILVLYLTAGVGPPQSGVPPMLLGGVPGQGTLNVFTDNMAIVKPGGKPVPIVDPVSPGMLANMLTWPSGRMVGSLSGAIFVVCNLGAFRSLMKVPGAVSLSVITPAIGEGKDETVTYYWLVLANTVDFTPTVKPIFPHVGDHKVVLIMADAPGQPGSANVIVERRSVDPLPLPGESIFQYNQRVFGGPPLFPIAQASGIVTTPDTTAWGVRAGVWQKQKTFSSILMTGVDGTWPQGPPVPQPTSRVFDGAAALPQASVAEKISVSSPPANTVTMHR